MKLLSKNTRLTSLALFLTLNLFNSSIVIAKGFDDKKKVDNFINYMVKKHRFDKKHLTQVFSKAKQHQSILDAIARPAEGKPWYLYRPIFITNTRIKGGIAFWKKHAKALARAEKKYGVPAEMIVAIIGVETRYGKHKGRYPVLDALGTLAFAYPKRAKFFKSELEHFLLMAREEKMNANSLLGSYAGAMGLPQFIPSSFRRYAVDFDGDGKRDLWNNPIDAIGSVANYFHKHHWKSGQAITQKVQVYGQQLENVLYKSLKPKHSVEELRKNGVLLPSVKVDSGKGKLVKLKTGTDAEYWVGWNNFYVITRYNHSSLYSMAAYQLSRKIKQGYLN